ncbi:ComEC/Rec2 family competence protein [Chloroflexota bacterium]
MKLIYLSVAWVAGIYIGSLFSLPLYAFLIALPLSLTVLLFRRKKQVILWGGLGIIVLLAAIGCYQWRTGDPTLPHYDAAAISELRGIVSADPEFDDGYSRLSLSAKEVNLDNLWKEVSGKVLVYTRSFPYYSQGDSLEIEGELYPISRVDDSGYREYLNKRGYCAIIYYPQIEFMDRGWVFSLRDRLAESLDSTLHEPQSSLSQSLLLGIRSHIPDSLKDSFNSSGTSHILAISGLHLAIMAGIVLSSAAWLFGKRRPTYILIAFGLIWIYALLSGMRPPAFRAAIMFSLFLTALWLGRPRSVMPSLALTAAIMVGIDPQILREVSFQLSFAAVAGIILLYPKFQRWGKKALGGKEGPLIFIANPITDSLAVTLAAIIATFPLIAYYFGYVSLMALPATFLILLAIPGAIILTLLTALLGLFAPPLSMAVGWVDWLFLSYIIEIAEFFGSSGFARQEMDINGIIVWAYYTALLAILLRKRLAMALSGIKGLAKAI